eukprot:NODE_33_length_36935_cov_1.609241.p10 type:complete len:377 gc:universal NODE_33_length_36935_cov_1.609241:26615-25485(-)
MTHFCRSIHFVPKLVKRNGVPVYFDYQATTPTDPRVVQRMLPYFDVMFGNPHSRTHAFGWESEKAVELARSQIAKLINADPKEIVFTSGATEANNTALKGISRFYKSESKNHIITTQTEHKCVLDSCRYLQTQGFEVTYLPVDMGGIVKLKDLENAIRPSTIMVSIMTVNNEIGVIQPMKEIGQLCKDTKVLLHTDAAQALGKIPIDVKSWNIAALSLSGHKIYGPKGIGALYVRRRPRVRLEPLIHGGGQERGLRSGTVPTPLTVGFGEACQLAIDHMAEESKRIETLSNRLVQGITSKLSHVTRNGDLNHTYPGCVNLSFGYVEGESLLMALNGHALSSGSACTSASLVTLFNLGTIVCSPCLRNGRRYGTLFD